MPPGECPDIDCGALCQYIDPVAAALSNNNPEAINNALAPALREFISEAVNGWAQFETDQEVNGGDLVEWFADWRSRVKAALITGKYERPEGLG